MVIVIIINILLAYLGNSNKSSRRIRMSWIELIRCHDELEVWAKQMLKTMWKFQAGGEDGITTKNPRGGRVIIWVRNRELGFEYMFSSVSFKKKVGPRIRLKWEIQIFGLCERWFSG